MSAGENTSSHDLHALLLQLQASNAHAIDHYDTSAWQRAKDVVHRAQAKVVDVLNPATAKHGPVKDKHAAQVTHATAHTYA